MSIQHQGHIFKLEICSMEWITHLMIKLAHISYCMNSYHYECLMKEWWLWAIWMSSLVTFYECWMLMLIQFVCWLFGRNILIYIDYKSLFDNIYRIWNWTLPIPCQCLRPTVKFHLYTWLYRILVYFDKDQHNKANDFKNAFPSLCQIISFRIILFTYIHLRLFDDRIKTFSIK